MFESPIYPVPTLVFREFRTRGVYTDFAAFRRTLAEEMTSRILPQYVSLAEEITANWYHQPTFTVASAVQPDGVRGWMIPVGPGAANWHRVSRGVKGHWITVKKPFTFRRFKGYKPALRLNRYAPKTYPGGGYGGIGQRKPPTAYRRKVWWPGITPRHFEEYMFERLAPQTRRLLENATRRAIRASRR